jgi:hypothetical protein
LKKNPPTRADDIHALGIVFCELLLRTIITIRMDNFVWMVEKFLNKEEAFKNAQRETEEEIDGSEVPESIKELMRRMIGVGGREQFVSCRQILNALINLRPLL